MRLSSSSFHRKSWLASLLAATLSLSAGFAAAQDDSTTTPQSQQKSGSGAKKPADASTKTSSKPQTAAKKHETKQVQAKPAVRICFTSR